jgi:glyoxylase I family protein
MVNLGLDHVHLYVKDLEEAVRFYEMVGLEFVEYTSHGGKAAMMRVPGSPVSFEIQETKVIDNPGLNHLAFVVDDLDDLCDSYKANGVKVDGPLDNKATGRRLATIRDPHGFLIQLVQKK